jgi:hypothetical protein
MKRRVVFLIVVAALLMVGCNKLAQFTNINFNVPYNQTVSIPIIDTGTLPPGGMSVMLPALAVPTNSQSYIDSFHTSSNNILRVNLSTLSMTQTGNADVNNFNFLDSVSVYISGPTLPLQLVAYQYSIPKGLDTLSLDTVSNVNLKPYFLLDTMYIQIAIHYNSIPAGNTELGMYSVFHILANPLD